MWLEIWFVQICMSWQLLQLPSVPHIMHHKHGKPDDITNQVYCMNNKHADGQCFSAWFHLCCPYRLFGTCKLFMHTTVWNSNWGTWAARSFGRLLIISILIQGMNHEVQIQLLTSQCKLKPKCSTINNANSPAGTSHAIQHLIAWSRRRRPKSLYNLTNWTIKMITTTNNSQCSCMVW